MSLNEFDVAIPSFAFPAAADYSDRFAAGRVGAGGRRILDGKRLIRRLCRLGRIDQERNS
jgi:hypothetical protein